MTYRHRRAFTLIELLVVIAIIAILAAILFPVFAQAKTAAKGTASISNNKQILTALIMYSTDYDDKQVPLGNTGEPDSPFLLGLTGLYKPWSYIILPYMKSGLIFQDPLTRPEDPIPGATDHALWSYRTQFGYNFAAHSPFLPPASGTQWRVNTLSQTQLAKPAETVLVTSKKARNNLGDWYWVGSPMLMANLVAPVLCLNGNNTGVNPDSYCAPAVRWGVGGYYQGTAPPTYEEGLYTGGMAMRRVGLAIVGMADGHTKALPPARIAAGTNWTRNTPYNQLVMTDREKYLWDAD